MSSVNNVLEDVGAAPHDRGADCYQRQHRDNADNCGHGPIHQPRPSTIAETPSPADCRRDVRLRNHGCDTICIVFRWGAKARNIVFAYKLSVLGSYLSPRSKEALT
jgi:hypothetical protein